MEVNAVVEENAAKQVRVSYGRKRCRSTHVDLEPEVEPVDPDEEEELVDSGKCDIIDSDEDPEDSDPNAQYIMVDRRPEDIFLVFPVKRTIRFSAPTLWTPWVPRILNPRTCKNMALD